MSQEYILVGTTPNDGLGDPLRTAFIKCNNNFTELYAQAQPFPPLTLVGQPGDSAGMYAYDPDYFYYCYNDFDGSSLIWARISQTSNVSVTDIVNGNSKVEISNYNGNVRFMVNNVPDVLVVTQSGIEVKNNITTTNDIFAGGNISAADTVFGNRGDFGNIIIYNDVITSDTRVVNINSGNYISDFSVNGGNANVLFVNGQTNTVSVGSNVQTLGATFAINATDSMLLPVGNTLQRPVYPRMGMLRFNETTATLEVYNGAFWVEMYASNFTIITDQQFVGDGYSMSFFLDTNQTTNSCIVTINGIMQMPMDAYNVNMNILTFIGEAPEYGDVIDVRGVITAEIVSDSFVGNGSDSTFVLSTSQTTESSLVTINGVIQNPGLAYTIRNDVIEFVFPPYVGDLINVRCYPGTQIATNSYTGTGNQTLFILPDTHTANSCIVSINGVVQVPSQAYTVAGTSLIFIQAPNLGDIIEVRQFTVVSKTGLYNSSGNASVVVSETSADVGVTGNLIVSGNVVTGNLINPNASGVGNIGSVSNYYNRVFAVSTSAVYSDLAENYVADEHYVPGTVLCFGGEYEVTVSDREDDVTVAGVVSTAPSYLMNANAEGRFIVSVALTGRVPTLVEGSVKKGDMMVSAGNGRAKASIDPKIGSVIGKALENFDGDLGVIEVVVGRL
jgi:hypothetical protein